MFNLKRSVIDQLHLMAKKKKEKTFQHGEEKIPLSSSPKGKVENFEIIVSTEKQKILLSNPTNNQVKKNLQ